MLQSILSNFTIISKKEGHVFCPHTQYTAHYYISNDYYRLGVIDLPVYPTNAHLYDTRDIQYFDEVFADYAFLLQRKQHNKYKKNC